MECDVHEHGPDGLSRLAQTAARCGITNPLLYRKISATFLDQLGQQTPRQTVRVITAIARVHYRDPIFLSKISRYLGVKASEFRNAELVLLISSLSRLDYENPDLMDVLASYVQPEELDFHGLTLLLKGLKAPRLGLLERVAAHMGRNLQEGQLDQERFNNRDVYFMLVALKAANIRPEFILEVIQSVVLQRAGKFKGLAPLILHAFVVDLDFGSDDLVHGLINDCKPEFYKLDSGDLAKLATVFRIRDPGFPEVLTQIFRRFHQESTAFSVNEAAEICELAQSLSLNPLFHQHLFDIFQAKLQDALEDGSLDRFPRTPFLETHYQRMQVSPPKLLVVQWDLEIPRRLSSNTPGDAQFLIDNLGDLPSKWLPSVVILCMTPLNGETLIQQLLERLDDLNLIHVSRCLERIHQLEWSEEPANLREFLTNVETRILKNPAPEYAKLVLRLLVIQAAWGIPASSELVNLCLAASGFLTFREFLDFLKVCLTLQVDISLSDLELVVNAKLREVKNHFEVEELAEAAQKLGISLGDPLQALEDLLTEQFCLGSVGQ